MQPPSSPSRPRAVVAAATLGEHRMTPTFASFGLRSLPGFSLDPFLNLDDFHMSEPTFPPHPHAGFSAVTYMFEDSAGAFVNRDSLGDRSRIGPGTLHWTQAARGMMHEEIPERPGVDCHGLQMFVNLSAVDEEAAPLAFHLDADAVPELHLAGARVRVLAGEVAGLASPLGDLLTPILLLDVHLQPSARVTLPVALPTCFALVVTGSGAAGAGTPIAAHHAVGFDRDGDAVAFEAGPDGLHLLLAAGTPIGEPVFAGGPFAMASPAALEAAKRRYQRGEMGSLQRSEAWK